MVTVGRVVRGHVDFEVIIILIITENKKQTPHTRTESERGSGRERERESGVRPLLKAFFGFLIRNFYE